MPSINSPTPDATTTTNGKIRLAQDLSGTAAAPTVQRMTDASGNALLLTSATASAVNQITVSNSSSFSPPAIAATGTDTNIALSLNTKGAGLLVKNGTITIADASNSLTLTNKSISGATNTISNISQAMVAFAPSSQTNAGSAGGTMYYINLGGIKMLWATSNSIAVSTAPTNLNYTLPSGFFTTIQSVQAAGVTAPSSTLYSYAASFNTTTVSTWVVSGGSQTIQNSIFVIGT